ncbi:unnamed protein product [Cylindrotheca closterium]|uniref:catechol O-methyltransferase n=1 Tax=Cylindrotheca closterium TaxID=2856 RepID=A0AAD2G087_9STRA|nr:unnamed protein product [Cylindrotheca closterium]
MAEDPFACFDDDNSESRNEVAAETEIVKRDPTCGILAFHAGTEQALLNHVTSTVSKSKASSVDAGFILESIDEFCMQRHWMMHVGPKKAPILASFLTQMCADIAKKEHITLVELGTYTGYSSIMISKELLEMGVNFTIYSVEVVEGNAQVAQALVKLAGVQDSVKILLLDPRKETLSTKLREAMGAGATIDFLFIDHDKSLYLPDLKQIEKAGYLKCGSYVAADNVVFAGIDDYRQYIGELVKNGIVESRLEESWLEYCEPDFVTDNSKNDLMKDGIELSIYLKDP